MKAKQTRGFPTKHHICYSTADFQKEAMPSYLLSLSQHLSLPTVVLYFFTSSQTRRRWSGRGGSTSPTLLSGQILFSHSRMSPPPHPKSLRHCLVHFPGSGCLYGVLHAVLDWWRCFFLWRCCKHTLSILQHLALALELNTGSRTPLELGPKFLHTIQKISLAM